MARWTTRAARLASAPTAGGEFEGGDPSLWRSRIEPGAGPGAARRSRVQARARQEA